MIYIVKELNLVAVMTTSTVGKAVTEDQETAVMIMIEFESVLASARGRLLTRHSIFDGFNWDTPLLSG
jgi:hypothetical protein